MINDIERLIKLINKTVNNPNPKIVIDNENEIISLLKSIKLEEADNLKDNENRKKLLVLMDQLKVLLKKETKSAKTFEDFKNYLEKKMF